MKYTRYVLVWLLTIAAVTLGPVLLAQAATGTSLPTLPDVSGADEWGNAFLWAMVSSWAMRFWREHPKLSGFTERTALNAQRLIGAAIGFASGLGITFVFDKGAGKLVISGLFLTAILHGVRQFLFQEFVYQSAIKRPSTTTIPTSLQGV